MKDDEGRICPECDGDGYIWIGEWPGQQIECPVCKGQKRLYD